MQAVAWNSYCNEIVDIETGEVEREVGGSSSEIVPTAGGAPRRAVQATREHRAGLTMLPIRREHETQELNAQGFVSQQHVVAGKLVNSCCRSTVGDAVPDLHSSSSYAYKACGTGLGCVRSWRWRWWWWRHLEQYHSVQKYKDYLDLSLVRKIPLYL